MNAPFAKTPYSSMSPGQQLVAMIQFMRARTADDIQSSWPDTRRVMVHQGLTADQVGTPPLSDEGVSSFKKDVLATTAMPLSNSIAALFDEQRADAIAEILRELREADELTIDSFTHYEQCGMLMNYATAPLMAAATVYLDIGNQLAVAHRYLSEKIQFDDNLLWQMKLVFAFNNLNVGFLDSMDARNPNGGYEFRASLGKMLKREFEHRLNRQTNTVPAATLKKAREANLISSDLMHRVMSTGQTNDLPNYVLIGSGAAALASLAGAVINIVLGGNLMLTGGLLALPTVLSVGVPIYLLLRKR